jgi:hypothetical protein
MFFDHASKERKCGAGGQVLSLGKPESKQEGPG